MPLPTPILDDRSYQQLRDELVRRIPVYTPEWTDHNPSDPGITLIELFAFLGENLLFRFNQIPESTRAAFLKLLQIGMRPACPARTILALTAAKDTLPAAIPVAAGTEAKAGSVSFEAKDGVDVWPLSLLGLCRTMGAEPETEEEVLFAQRTIGKLSPDDEPVYYTTSTVPLDPAAPTAVAVDFGKAVDGMVWAAVIGPEDAGVRAALLDELRDGVLAIGVLFDEAAPDIDHATACPGDGASATSHPIEWQVSTGRISTTGEPVYKKVSVVGDTTRGLAREGVVKVQLPKAIADLGNFVQDDPDLLGAGDFPPEIEDEELAARVMFFLRAFRTSDKPLPKVLWLGANAVEIVQTRTARAELVGVGTADADQTYTLVHKPLVAGSLSLQVEEPDGFRDWQEVDGFHASKQDDRHYVIDAEAGVVRFGNGIRGLAPQIGQRIRANGYRYGGGVAGNVAAKAVSQLVGVSGVKAANPLAARGGSAAETIAEAMDRIPTEMRRRDRCVTRGDFQELALATPGADLGRTECMPLFHPPTRTLDAAGVVTVVVWPREDAKSPNAPMPDRATLDLVCAWLDARRLVTTELFVIAPTYRKVAVSVGVKVKPGYAVEAVRRWVELVIRQYLAPLPPFGPEGRGWPLGRRVYGPELMAAALQVEGVEFLDGDGLVVAGQDADGEWVTGPVELSPWEVPELSEITVIEGPPLEPGDAIAPPAKATPEGKTPVPVPVPTLKVEC